MMVGWFYNGIQVLINGNKYYTKNFEWVELKQPYTTVQPPTCKKCEFDGANWVVLEEYEEINVYPIKTTEEKLAELIAQVSIMDEAIAELMLNI